MQRRAKYHKAYEQRAASGAQKKYYERTKRKKRAEYDAAKAAIMDKEYTLGADILAPASSQ